MQICSEFVAFFKNLTVSERLDIIEKKFNIPLTEELEGGVNNMSNLGEGIREAAYRDGFKEGEASGETRGENRGEARGKAQLIKTMYNNDVFCEEIARITEIELEDVKKAVYGSDPVTV